MKADKHFFAIEDAIRYGILEAILLENFRFWIGTNRANGKNLHGGRTWTYNSVRAYAEQFPYASPKQIRRALDRLVDAGVLDRGRNALNRWDKTSWYSFVDEDLHDIPSVAELQERMAKRPRKKARAPSSIQSGPLPRPPAARQDRDSFQSKTIPPPPAARPG